MLIKGINEKHDLIQSDIPITQMDLMAAYLELLDGKQSEELFSDVPDTRIRTVLFHQNDLNLIEYETNGKSTEYDKFKPTGRVYPYSY